MNWFEALILGIIQGITEFLPISSSAHLIIVQKLFDLEIPGLAYEVFLHLASLLAVIIFYRHDLIKLIKEFFGFIINRNPKYKSSFWFSSYLIIATIITGVLGIILENKMDANIKSMTIISITLLITGIALILIEKVIKHGNRSQENMTIMDAIWVGLAQTIAVIPGISRAGSTLIVALWCGLEKATAVRFSFMLSIPVILGSTVLMLPDMSFEQQNINILSLAISFVASFIFAIIGIKWLISFLNRSKLIYFAYYCFILSAFVFVFLR
jgi:undecaprenyl-diphosphatase